MFRDMQPQGGGENLPSFRGETEPDESGSLVPPLLMGTREEIASNLLPGYRGPSSLRQFHDCGASVIPGDGFGDALVSPTRLRIGWKTIIYTPLEVALARCSKTRMRS